SEAWTASAGMSDTWAASYRCDVMGSPAASAAPQHVLEQQGLSPVLTRIAARAYFSLTTSLMSIAPSLAIGPFDSAGRPTRSPGGSRLGSACSTPHTETREARSAPPCWPRTTSRCLHVE